MLKFDYDISSWSFEWFEALWGHAVFWLWIVGKSAHQIFFTFVKTSDWLTTNLIHLQFKSDNVSLKKCYFWVIIFLKFPKICDNFDCDATYNSMPQISRIWSSNKYIFCYFQCKQRCWMQTISTGGQSYCDYYCLGISLLQDSSYLFLLEILIDHIFKSYILGILFNTWKVYIKVLSMGF